jgi:RHS repeat-associated protein
MSYDKNGNILALQRKGEYEDNALQLQTDNLNYFYNSNSNQLLKVTDLTNNSNGFKDDSNGYNDTVTDYTYDANGNMIADQNKSILNIKYNHLNLPNEIIFSGTNKKINYLYNSVGVKVKKIVTNGATVTTTDYFNGFQYDNAVLKFFPTAEGYVSNTVAGLVSIYNYVYNYTDHLGNIRLSYTKDPITGNLKTIDENHYYPFGLKQKGYNTTQFEYALNLTAGVKPSVCTTCSYKYKYNGKELQDELGLNVYDYGWRNYMPDIGRWTQIDPLFNDLEFAHDINDVDPDDQEEVYMAIINDLELGGGIYNTDNLNPYGYGYNNPVSFDDPDGRCPSCDDDPIGSLLSWTDVDDITVAVTTVTRRVFGMYDGKPKHVDGTDASGGDYVFLIAGAILPGISGGGLKKIFKGGEDVVETVKKTEKVTGHTKHGLNQSINRNGGKGVSAKAKSNAINKPKSVTKKPDGTTAYKGKNATVVVNKDKKIVTTFGSSRSKAPAKPQGRASGGGKAQRRTVKTTGTSYNPNIVR